MLPNCLQEPRASAPSAGLLRRIDPARTLQWIHDLDAGDRPAVTQILAQEFLGIDAREAVQSEDNTHRTEMIQTLILAEAAARVTGQANEQMQEFLYSRCLSGSMRPCKIRII